MKKIVASLKYGRIYEKSLIFLLSCIKIIKCSKMHIMARWSSGQDAALSRRNQGFDSPTSCWLLMKIKQPNPRSSVNTGFSSGYVIFFWSNWATLFWLLLITFSCLYYTIIYSFQYILGIFICIGIMYITSKQSFYTSLTTNRTNFINIQIRFH